MKKRMTGYHMDGLIALLLFGVFAACLLAVLLTGAGAYKRLVDRDEGSYNFRTGVQYIAARVHQAPAPEAVGLEPFGEGNALAIADQDGCITRVYYYDGYLMELYTEAGFAMHPQDGEKVMEAEGLDLFLEDGLLKMTVIEKDGESNFIVLHLEGGKGEAG